MCLDHGELDWGHHVRKHAQASVSQEGLAELSSRAVVREEKGAKAVR